MEMNAVPLGFDEQLTPYVINYNDLRIEKSIAEGMKPWFCYHIKLCTQAYKGICCYTYIRRYSYIAK